MAQTRAIKYTGDETINHTPAAAVTSGDVVIIGGTGGIIGVAIGDIAASVEGALAIDGIYLLPKKTGAIVAGLPVFWEPAGTPVVGDSTSGAANQTGQGTYAGIAAEAAVSGAGYVPVLLNKRNQQPASTVAATGSTQADAAQLPSAGFCLVTAGDGTKGVLLPAAVAGLTVTVKNSSGSGLKVYPATGDTINALSANAAITIATQTCPTFHCYDGTAWYTNPLLPS